MKTVTATLVIEVLAHCPGCNYMIDLRNEDETNGDCLDDEGNILRQACPTSGNHWTDEHKKFEVKEVTCTQCKTKFNVKGLDW